MGGLRSQCKKMSKSRAKLAEVRVFKALGFHVDGTSASDVELWRL
jgi:hypothetical protein